MRSSRGTLMGAMAVSVIAIGTAAIVDQQRSSAAALDDFAREQAVLARAVGTGLELHLEALQAGEPDRIAQTLLRGVTHLERPRELAVLIQRPGVEGLLSSDGRLLASATLTAAIAAHADRVVLPRDEAVNLGMQQRLAVAGIDTAEGQGGVWNVVVVASAATLRDRERHGIARVSLTVAIVALVVLGFGGAALRLQRTQLLREREELLARADRMATVAALSSGIAHELATPLAVISTRLEQLTTGVPASTLAGRAAAAIAEQLGRIEAVMRGFLSLARGDAPMLSPEAPQALAQRAVELVTHRFAAAHVALTLEVGPRLPEVRCDARLFEQVLVNLLLNACEASAAGSGVSLTLRGAERAVVFEVADRGSGLSSEALARSTEPFFTTKRTANGTGLGLAIAREIVSHHQGTLRLERRTDGPGTLASVTLRVDAENLPTPGGETPTGPLPG